MSPCFSNGLGRQPLRPLLDEVTGGAPRPRSGASFATVPAWAALARVLERALTRPAASVSVAIGLRSGAGRSTRTASGVTSRREAPSCHACPSIDGSCWSTLRFSRPDITPRSASRNRGEEQDQRQHLGKAGRGRERDKREHQEDAREESAHRAHQGPPPSGVRTSAVVPGQVGRAINWGTSRRPIAPLASTMKTLIVVSFRNLAELREL